MWEMPMMADDSLKLHQQMKDKKLTKRETTNVLYMWICICLSQLLLSALNEQCQVSTVRHWGFFKVSLAQSAMNYWAWASSVPVLFMPLLTPSFFPQVCSLWPRQTKYPTNDGVTVCWSMLGNFLCVQPLQQEGQITGSNTEQEGFGVLLKDI